MIITYINHEVSLVPVMLGQVMGLRISLGLHSEFTIKVELVDGITTHVLWFGNSPYVFLHVC